MNRIKELQAKRKAVEVAESALAAFIQKAWPVGSRIHWDHHGYIQYGKVLCHNEYSDSLRVENFHTGNKVWIDSFCLRDYGLEVVDERE